MASEHIDERRDGRNNTNTHTKKDTENIMLQMHEITKCGFFLLLRLFSCLCRCAARACAELTSNFRCCRTRSRISSFAFHFFFGYGVIASSYFRLI